MCFKAELRNVTDMADICVKILGGWGKKSDLTRGYARKFFVYIITTNINFCVQNNLI